MIELPLAIILWFIVLFLTLTTILTIAVLVSGEISKYQQHKQQLKWDEVMKGIRK